MELNGKVAFITGGGGMSMGDLEAGFVPKELLERMMEPVWLGRAVARAIDTNELYVISHPAYKPAVQQRAQALLAAHREAAQPGRG